MYVPFRCFFTYLDGIPEWDSRGGSLSQRIIPRSFPERRIKQRYELQLALAVWPSAAPEIAYSATTVNVNAAGMLFVLHSGNPDNLRPGAPFRFSLELAELPDDANVQVVGRGYVVRTEEGSDRRIASITSSWRLVHHPVEDLQLSMTS